MQGRVEFSFLFPTILAMVIHESKWNPEIWPCNPHVDPFNSKMIPLRKQIYYYCPNHHDPDVNKRYELYAPARLQSQKEWGICGTPVLTVILSQCSLAKLLSMSLMRYLPIPFSRRAATTLSHRVDLRSSCTSKINRKNNSFGKTFLWITVTYGVHRQRIAL